MQDQSPPLRRRRVAHSFRDKHDVWAEGPGADDGFLFVFVGFWSVLKILISHEIQGELARFEDIQDEMYEQAG